MAERSHLITLTVDPMFSGLYVAQRAFQARLMGDVPSALEGTERKAYVREQALALTDELHEALAEIGWKSWATSTHLNREAYKGELADVLIFLMNLMLVADITPSELMESIKAKQVNNHKRQDDGYDGVTTKCPRCKRASDDNAVKCRPHGTGDGAWWCDQAKSDVDVNGRQLP
jgi:NTP pyrophosphatase (non-canonical NTP hydrolase)